MKESVATIRVSENRGSLMANSKSRRLWSFADGLGLSVFFLASSAQANTASMALIRDVNGPLDVQREQCLFENKLSGMHNHLSFTRDGREFTIALR